MPKSKQYEDAMSSVFDFIFEQSKKSPTKVKPVKVTGVDGTSEYVDAIAATLEAPLLFVNNNTLEAFKDATDIDFAAFQVGGRKSDGIKLNVNDLKDMLSDPSGFVNKKFSKIEGARKMQRLAWAGEEMKGVLGAVWARQHKLDFDTQQALMSSAKSSEGRTDVSATEMAKRTEFLAEKHFGSGGSVLGKADFERMYGKGPKADKAYKKYSDAYAAFSTTQDVTSKDYKDIVFDRDLYAVLEGVEIRGKAQSASTREERMGYISAASMIENSRAFANMKEYISQQKNARRSHQQEIDRLKKVPGSQSLIDDHRARIREIDSSLGAARSFQLGDKLGEWEGAFYSYKDYVFDGNLLPNIINGKFFTSKYNKIAWLQPSETKAGLLGLGMGDLEVHYGKRTGNKFKDIAYDKMNSLYYLSPVTWVKTLYNGEGFAYMMLKNREKFEKSLATMMGQKLGKLTNGDDVFKLLAGNDKALLNLLSGKLTAAEESLLLSQFSPELQAVLKNPQASKILSGFLKKDSRLRKLVDTFSFVSRVKARVAKWFEDKVGKKVRLKIATALLKSKLVRKYAGKILGQWIAKGGLQLLIKGLVTTITSALGIVGTPLASAVVGVLTWIAMDLVYALSKPLIKGVIVVLKLMLFAGLGFLAIGGAFIFSILGQHSHVAPTQIVSCSGFSGTSPIIDPDNPDNLPPGGPLEPFVAGSLPSGVECLLGDSAYNCSQGVYGTYSHKNSPAVDLTNVNYFHAPSFCDVADCQVTYFGPVNCTAGYAGGLLKFTATYEGNTYEFKLIHVDSSFSVGDSLSGGERVARVMEHSETGSACSSGKHLHLETKFNGAVVNPYDMMTSSTAEGGFGCSVSLCP